MQSQSDPVGLEVVSIENTGFKRLSLLVAPIMKTSVSRQLCLEWTNVRLTLLSVHTVHLSLPESAGARIVYRQKLAKI